MPRVVLKPAARRDLIEHFSHIGESSGEEMARRFLRNACQSFDQLAVTPRIGAGRKFRNPKYADVRMWRVHGFEKHLIFYCPRKDGVSVMRVIYGTRNIERLFR